LAKIKTRGRQFEYYLQRALWILISWVLIYISIFLFEYMTLKSYNALTSEYDLWFQFTRRLIIAVTSGLIGGLLTINLMDYWLRKYAFWKALLLISITYIITAIGISTLGGYYYIQQYEEGNLNIVGIKEQAIMLLGDWQFLKELIIWFFIVIGTLIVQMVNDKYGPGVFKDYLLGHYFMPKGERRIFMFADIKNATGIAEVLGEQRYFNFLKHFFNDIAPAIMQTRGEVYQYVGDEVVVTWKMKNGLKKSNALHCFYLMKAILERKRTAYIQKFDVFPEFKVGFHYGSVTVGELGKIKRDIAFSGDVLNTTARIQSICNAKGVDNLASKSFANLLVKLPEGVTKRELGAELLKGKAGTIELVTFEKEI